MMRSYAREAGAEAAMRKFNIISLQRAAGRSAETAWTTWDGLKWDPHFKHAFGEVSALSNEIAEHSPLGSWRQYWFAAMAEGQSCSRRSVSTLLGGARTILLPFGGLGR